MTIAPDMIIHSRTPLNAEPPLERLAVEAITPTRHFYVRSHGAVPEMHDHGLQVGPALRLAVAELQSRFAVHTVVATLQCAGNRRADLQPVAPTSGDPWAAGAIGTAAWTGVRLGDVLQSAGLVGEHVGFEALDTITEGAVRTRFGVSIPFAKAMAPEVLLAWAMNGQPLAPEHGAPLRVVVPGYAGVRSPKWLARIAVQDAPSDNPVQASDYRFFPADVTAETARVRHGLTINAMPVTSAICVPSAGRTVAAGVIALRGYAIASDRGVARVEVSAGDGRWRQARLASTTRWAWTLWDASLELPPGEHVLTVRAWDDAGQVQPEAAAAVWNYKGYLSTAWHRVTVIAA